MKTRTHSQAVSRRTVLAGIGAGAAAVTLAPRLALADKAATDEYLGKLTGGATPQTGKVSLKLPQIAENGNTVQFTVSVDNPMTPENYVKTIHVVAEGNPAPGVASFHFTPTGKPEITMRMRLSKTQDVRALAVLSDGSVYQGSQEVKVTIGGCGG